MTVSSADVWLRALDVFEAALAAGPQEASVAAVKGLLAGIDDPDLLRRLVVAEVLVSLSLSKAKGPRDIARLLRWVERQRLEVAWVGSDA